MLAGHQFGFGSAQSGLPPCYISGLLWLIWFALIASSFRPPVNDISSIQNLFLCGVLGNGVSCWCVLFSFLGVGKRKKGWGEREGVLGLSSVESFLYLALHIWYTRVNQSVMWICYDRPTWLKYNLNYVYISSWVPSLCNPVFKVEVYSRFVPEF